MTGNDAEMIAAVVAGLVLGGTILKVFYRIFTTQTSHGARIASGETISQNTARILERTTLTVARLEERTKHI